MRVMNSFWLVLFLAVAGVSHLTAATLTNIWPLTTPSQYMVSDPTKIEVADGVAKLKLQANKIFGTLISEYQTNTFSSVGVVMGPDVCLALQNSGSRYQVRGEYESRVFDGGVGNTWTALRSRAFNQFLRPSFGEIQPSVNNILALYHFNNNPNDEVTGSYGALMGGATFKTNSCLGSHALSCGPGYFQTLNSTLLAGKIEYTVMCWVTLRAYVSDAGIVTSRGSGPNYYFMGLCVGTGADGAKRVKFYTSSSGGNVATPASKSTLNTNAWYFIAGVRDSSGKQTLYINGVAETDFTPALIANLSQEDFFKVGVDDYDVIGRSQPCLVDEVAIFDRALTAVEISGIYLRTAAVGLRLRSGTSSVLSGQYVGPDGTPNTYYAKPYEALVASGSFNPNDQYLQYKVNFMSDLSQGATPYLDAVKISGTLSDVLDDNLGEFLNGTFTVGTTNYPGAKDTPYVGIAKNNNGGYSPNGTFTSRILDAGSSVTWSKISWDQGSELPNTLTGLEGLWHMNQSWGDVSGKGHVGVPGGVAGAVFTPYAKLGSYSAVFNGVDSVVYIGSMGAPISTVEWWMKMDKPDGGIMQLLSSNIWIEVTNNLISVGGSNATVATVYVNGASIPALAPGWNHVAVTFSICN